MTAKMYYDNDADPAALAGQTVAIIGYGSQGHAHALNLHESGVDVVVGLAPWPTDALARGLGAAGHSVLLVVPSPAAGGELGTTRHIGPDPQIAWLPSFQVPRPAPAGYRVPRPVPSAALEVALAFAPQVIHAQSPFTSGLMARRLARRLEVPLVFTHHTRFGDYRHYLGPLGVPGSALMEAHLLRFWRRCAAIVAPGSELAAEIADRLGPRRRPMVRTIPTGIEVSELAALAAVDPRSLAGWPADALVVTTLGRLAPEKSVGLVLEAFAEVSAEAPQIRLLMVGGGPSEPSLRERAARPDLVAVAIKPDYALGPHTASLGLTFSTGARLGPRFASGAFIGQHGSWNRKPPAGYRVIFVPFAGAQPSGMPVEVLTGFMVGGKAYGRPVGVQIARDGSLLVADDVGGKVWRVSAPG